MDASTSTNQHKRQKTRAYKKTSNRNRPKPPHVNIFPPEKPCETQEHFLKESRVILSEFEGTDFLELLKNSGIDLFASYYFTSYLSDVTWFYKHVTVKVNPYGRIGKRVVIKVKFGEKNQNGYKAVKYTDVNFKNDFGLTSGGYCTYKTSAWPENLPSLEDMSVVLNNVENPVDPKLLKGGVISNMTGTDKLIAKVVKEILFLTNSHDNKMTRLHTIIVYLIKIGRKIDLPVLLGYHLRDALTNLKTKFYPLKGLITHIVREWDPHEPLEKLVEPLVIDIASLKKQKLVIACGRLIHASEVNGLSDEERIAYNLAREAMNARVVEEDETMDEQPANAPRGRRVHQDDYFAQILEGQNRIVEGQNRLFEGQNRLFEGQQRIIQTQERFSTDMEELREWMSRMQTQFNNSPWGRGSS